MMATGVAVKSVSAHAQHVPSSVAHPCRATMPEWVADLQQFWAGPSAVCAALVVLEAVARPQISRVSLDIMEFCDLSCLQESSQSIWSNLGVTSALILTVAASMLQVDQIEPRFAHSEATSESLGHIHATYDLLCGVSLLYSAAAMLQCVLSLCYVNPLSNKDTIKFFIANPASIGNVALNTIFGCFYCALGIVVWIFGTSGVAHGCIFVVFMIVALVCLLWEVYDKASFDPSGLTPKSSEWTWTTKPREEWPYFVRGVKSEKELRVLMRMGAAVERGGRARKIAFA